MHKALTALALVGIGCGGGSGTIGLGDNSTPGGFCANLLSAYVDAWARCTGTPREVIAEQVGPASPTNPLCLDIKKSATAGRIVYDPQKGATCLTTLASQACAELSASDGLPVICSQALGGQVPAGGSCYTAAFDCAAGTFCADFGGPCPWTCVAFGKLGDDCTAVDFRCADGTFCSQSSGKCAAPGGSGVPCDGSSGSCAPGFYCAGPPGGGGPGTCANRQSVGATCTANDECAFPAGCNAASKCENPHKVGESCTQGGRECIDGLYCSPTTQTCATRRIAKVGESCQLSFGAEDVICTGSFCSPNPMGGATCTAYKKLGETCANPGDECEEHYQCDNGTCITQCVVP